MSEGLLTSEAKKANIANDAGEKTVEYANRVPGEYELAKKEINNYKAPKENTSENKENEGNWLEDLIKEAEGIYRPEAAKLNNTSVQNPYEEIENSNLNDFWEKDNNKSNKDESRDDR